MKNPWKTLSTRQIYKNDWIRLREDQVITPTGTSGIYSVVEAKPAIGIVPLTNDLQTCLVGQYRYTLKTYSWEIPEGGGLDHEDTLDGAKRELLEETGLTAKKMDLSRYALHQQQFHRRNRIYLSGGGSDQRHTKPDHTEDLRVKMLPFRDAWQMVINFEIKDALAIIGIQRAYQYLKSAGRVDF